jgi:thioredoxin 2
MTTDTTGASTTEPATGQYVTVPCQFCGTRNKVNMARVAHRPKCRNADCAKPILLDRPITLRDDTFADVIARADVPVLVDFYADWCGPCKVMAPVLDTVAGEYAGRALVVKVDTDRAPVVSQQFAIRSIPTLMVFRGGKSVGQQMGAVPKAAVVAMLTAAGA